MFIFLLGDIYHVIKVTFLPSIHAIRKKKKKKKRKHKANKSTTVMDKEEKHDSYVSQDSQSTAEVSIAIELIWAKTHHTMVFSGQWKLISSKQGKLFATRSRDSRKPYCHSTNWPKSPDQTFNTYLHPVSFALLRSRNTIKPFHRFVLLLLLLFFFFDCSLSLLPATEWCNKNMWLHTWFSRETLLKTAEFSSVSTLRHKWSAKTFYFSDASAHFLITDP